MKRFTALVFGLNFAAAAYACANSDLSDELDQQDATPAAESGSTLIDAGSDTWDDDASSLDVRDRVDAGIDEVATDNPIHAIALGRSVSCAIIDTSERANVLKCWGLDTLGQTGIGRDGGAAIVVTPTEVPLENVRQVSVGRDFTCALSGDGGDVRCWGSKLGGGFKSPPPSPVLTSAVEIAAGESHACARVEDGGVFCWGTNNRGQLGVGDRTNRSSPTQIPNFTGEDLALGGESTCARSHAGDEVWCWGSNRYGQLGTNILPDSSVSATPPDYNYPSRVQGLNGTVSRLTAASASVCAIMTDGTAHCWGRLAKRPGVVMPATGWTYAPVLLQHRNAPDIDNNMYEPFRDVVTVAIGGQSATSATHGPHFCALFRSGNVDCWGANNYGQLGPSRVPPPSGEPPTWTPYPRTVDRLTHATDVAAGAMHTCARVGKRRLKCWGRNDSGECGVGAINDRIEPVPINVVDL